MPAFEQLSDLENSLGEASQKAAHYEWMKAAEVYRRVLDGFDRTPDKAQSANVLQLLADSYFNAAFQASTRTEFRRLMRLSEKSHLDASSLYMSKSFDALANSAEAKAAFAEFWTLDNSEERRKVLEKRIQLAEKASQSFELHGDKVLLRATLRDLLVYQEKAAQFSVERKPLVEHFEKALEAAWRILEEFQEPASEHTELETINILTRLYVHAENVIEHPRYEELEKNSRSSLDDYPNSQTSSC